MGEKIVSFPLGIPEDIDKYFYNRKRELFQIKSLTDSLNHNIGNHILLTGFRGVGKSFLLKKFMQTVPKNILTCYIDISKIYAMEKSQLTEEEILYNLLNEMNNSIKKHENKLKNIYLVINNLLEKLKRQDYDFKDAGNILSIPIPKLNDSYQKLSKFVMEFPQKIVEKSKGDLKGFIIIIDEFQFIGELNSPESFFWLIRSFTQEQDNVSYIFTGSTSSASEIVEKLNGLSGAFGNKMIHLDINPFSEKECYNYLNDKLPEIKFTKDGLKRFYKCSRGYPAYINSFANVMENNKTYNEKMVTREFHHKIDQIAIKWITIWSSLSKYEKEIITTLIENKPLKLRELTEIVEFSKKTLVLYINKLKNMGIVSHLITKYTIDDYMLVVWLKHRKNEDSYYPL